MQNLQKLPDDHPGASMRALQDLRLADAVTGSQIHHQANSHKEEVLNKKGPRKTKRPSQRDESSQAFLSVSGRVNVI